MIPGTIRILAADNADALIEEMTPPGNIEGVAEDWSAQSFPLPAPSRVHPYDSKNSGRHQRALLVPRISTGC
ncbi:MAG: hypothetical protein ACKJSK_19700 [Roseibacillus sp.]